MLKIAVLASGSGTNLQAIIDAIEAKRLDARITLVLGDKPGAFALERARSRSIPTAVVTKAEFPKREEFDAKAVSLLKESSAELIVLAGFMRLLSPVFIKAFPMRIVNIHPSLLPAFPGLDVQKKAIEHGARFSGCTVHFVDEGLDSGPIIIQAVVPVLSGDTPEALAKRILKEEHRIYTRAIQLYAEGRISVNGRKVSIAGNAEPSADAALENPRVE